MLCIHYKTFEYYENETESLIFILFLKKPSFVYMVCICIKILFNPDRMWGYFHLHFYIHFVIRSLPHTDLHCGTLLYAYRKALTPPPTETHHIHILTANKDPKCKTRFQKYIYIKWYNQPSNQLGNIYQPTPQRSPRLHLFFWTHKHQPSLALWCLAAFYLQRSSSLVPALTSTLLPFLLSCCHFR